MKRNATRILTLVLAIALIMSMSLTAFALDGHEMYMSPATGTSYTTMVDSDTDTVDLEVFFTAYNDGNYYNTGFNNEAQAKNVIWTVTNNADGLVSGNVAVSSGTCGNYTTSKGTVTLDDEAVGVAVVHAAYNSLTLDLVIARDEEDPSTASVSAKTYVVDVSGTAGNVIESNLNVGVYSPATNNEALSGILLNKEAAFQNQATAMGTLDVLLKASNNNITSVTLSDDGSYANAINGLYYWSYAVYDASGNLVPLSQNISASIFVLPASNYTVVWKYGGWSFASTFDAEKTSWGLPNTNN